MTKNYVPINFDETLELEQIRSELPLMAAAPFVDRNGDGLEGTEKKMVRS